MNAPAKTKFELITINARLATENAALRMQLANTKLDLEIMRGNAAALCDAMDRIDPIKILNPSSARRAA